MSGARIPMHGRDHGYGHSDPIPDIITSITSVDNSVTVSRSPTHGPTVDLSAAASLTSAIEFLTSSVTATANSTATFSFAHSSGSTLLDLTTPTQPKITTTGVYLLHFHAQTTASVNAGRTVHLGVTIATSATILAGDSFTSDSTNTDIGAMSVSPCLKLFNTDVFGANATNYDSASRTFNLTATVTQLL